MSGEINENIRETGGDSESTVTVVRPDKLTKDLTTRLSRIEGQIKGIKGMIERGSYCDDVLTQVSSAQAALYSVSKLLLESHIRTCIVERLKKDDEEAILELIKTIGRML